MQSRINRRLNQLCLYSPWSNPPVYGARMHLASTLQWGRRCYTSSRRLGWPSTTPSLWGRSTLGCMTFPSKESRPFTFSAEVQPCPYSCGKKVRGSHCLSTWRDYQRLLLTRTGTWQMTRWQRGSSLQVCPVGSRSHVLTRNSTAKLEDCAGPVSTTWSTVFRSWPKDWDDSSNVVDGDV